MHRFSNHALADLEFRNPRWGKRAIEASENSIMKRDHQYLRHQEIAGGGGGEGSSGGYDAVSMKAAQNDAGTDELLAALGYKVRSSDMAEVAQKLEQLEEVMGNTYQQDELSNLVSETVHFNPSDLSSWLETMLSELNPPNLDHFFPPSTLNQSQILDDPSKDYDLKAIPGKAIYGNTQIDQECTRDSKRLKPDSVNLNPLPSSSSMIILDSQDNGIRLVHALTACAEAIQHENLNLAAALANQIGILAAAQAGAMGKVAAYFAEAIAIRIYRFSPQNSVDDLHLDNLNLYSSFYETCPYLKFAHLTANQAILEAFAGKDRVHVIDFGMKQGIQWPMLMQLLALRPGGAPALRITGIGPPAVDGGDHLQEVGRKLAQVADSINVKFEYRGFLANSLADLEASTLDLRPGEAVAVNSVFELHRLLAGGGKIEKVLSVVREMKPEIMTVVEQEANHNGPVFFDRFMEALHYYSTLFDSMEGVASPEFVSGCGEGRVLSEMYLGRQICNVVASEGSDRVERHEPLDQWRPRLESAGFEPAHLGSNAFKQASMLTSFFAGGEGYRVEENGGCLTLGWHTRPLVAASAWKLG